MSVASTTLSSSYNAVAQLLSRNQSSSSAASDTPQVAQTGNVDHAGASRGDPTDTVDLSERAKAVLSQANRAGNTQLQEQLSDGKNSGGSAVGSLADSVLSEIALTVTAETSSSGSPDASLSMLSKTTSSVGLGKTFHTPKGSYTIYYQWNTVDTYQSTVLDLVSGRDQQASTTDRQSGRSAGQASNADPG